jgi:membrane fusion protein, multidrug efflux system
MRWQSLFLSAAVAVFAPASVFAQARPAGESPGRASLPIVVPDCRVLLLDQVTLAADRSGVLSATMPREGDRVKEGQIVARLRDSVAVAAVAVARKKADNDVEVRYAEKAAAVARTEYERSVEANRRLAGTVPDIELKRLQLAAERATLQIEQASHDLEVKRLERVQAEADLGTYTVEAPFDGVITRVIRSRGESVRQGDPVVEVASTARVKIEGEIPLKQGFRVKPGQTVAVQLELDDLPPDVEKKAFAGKIVFVDVTAQPVSGRIRIWAEVENQENLLRAGLPAKMTIETGNAKNQESGVRRQE